MDQSNLEVMRHSCEHILTQAMIRKKNGKIFYARNVNYFFEQYLDNVYELLPGFTIKKGMTIVDVGAASGEYTTYALEKKARVIAFEPDKKHFEYLMKNTSRLKNAEIYNLAIGNKEDKLTRKLDSILKKIQHIDILKIDVEGNEVNVLNGAKKTISKTEMIVMEIHSGELLKQCKSILKKGFIITVKNIYDDENSQPIIYAIRKSS